MSTELVYASVCSVISRRLQAAIHDKGEGALTHIAIVVSARKR